MLDASIPPRARYPKALTILRQAFDHDGTGDSMGLYFGATSGDVFGSADAGASWFTVAPRLAPVTSVRVA